MGIFGPGKKEHQALLMEVNTLRRTLERTRALLEQSNDQGRRLEQQLQEQQQKHQELQTFVDKHGGKEAWEKDAAITAIRQELADLEEKKAAALEEMSLVRARRHLAEAGLTNYGHPAQDSIALQGQLADIRKKISAHIRGYHAVHAAPDFAPPTTKSGREKLGRDTAKLALRAFNAEVENILSSATANNLDASLTKIFKAAESLENLGKVAEIKLDPEFVELRARELKLAVDHLKTKQLEKELERERKAALREEARVERELEAERKRLEKEKQHYLNVLQTVEAAGDEQEAQRLRERLVEIEKGINDVAEREANIRAGYVYVISNLGAFGPNMVKIGMTRRLDPMDRVRELGDASVPFGFDVHALFFSDDAVGVEAELHRRFAEQRVNKINLRREFFRVTPAQAREQLADIAGNLLEFREEPEAEQYRRGLELAASGNLAPAGAR